MTSSPDYCWFRLLLGTELVEVDVLAFVRSLTSVPVPRGLFGADPLVFELRAEAGQLSHWLRVVPRHRRSVLAQLRVHLPGVRAVEVEAADGERPGFGTAQIVRSEGTVTDGGTYVAGAELRLTSKAV